MMLLGHFLWGLGLKNVFSSNFNITKSIQKGVLNSKKRFLGVSLIGYVAKLA